MNDEFNEIIKSGVENWNQGAEMMERVLRAAHADAVFRAPISHGDYTVITAAEVSVGMGFGYGSGAGKESATDEADTETEQGGGGGGGAGGGAAGRPVAAISIGPDGVEVEPIFDPTKIALAFFTMVGAFLIMLGRMRRAARR